jgi:Domain of unknown function (DUF4276)
MGVRVVVVASGETERLALPHLLAHVPCSIEVRIPPRGDLTIQRADQILRAAWWEAKGRGEPPDKAVVLVDADAKDADVKEDDFAPLLSRIGDLPLPVRIVAAKWHLEAWFFADFAGLRAWLGGKSPGRIETPPDQIELPKHRLRNLLSEPYTARTAGSIASSLSSATIRQRSPSFAKFEDAVRNGAPAAEM